MPVLRHLVLGTAALIAASGAVALAQDSGASEGAANGAGVATVSTGTDSASIDAQFTAGRHESGRILAKIERRMTMGNNLMLDVVFQPTTDGMEVDPEGEVPATVIYSNVARNTYEQIYLIAGDKKYMAVTDSQDKVSVTQNLQIKGKGPIIGQWNGVFPAPPANTPVMLYLPGFSPIGPFSVPAT